MGEIGVVDGAELITIFGEAEDRRRKRGASPEKTEAGSLRQAQGRLSPGLRPVRNENAQRASLENFDQMTPKELGEFAEAEFLRTVLKMGMAITKPWGESRGYDFIVDAAGRLTRVQVKAAFRQGRQGGYSLRTYRSSKRCYTPKEIDALAGYVATEDAWYLFPVRVVQRVRSLKLFPGSKKKRSKFERWREAWWVIGK
jgi:hypothetical protein